MFAKKMGYFCLLPALLAVALLCSCGVKTPRTVHAPDETSRQAWLRELGWQVEAAPLEILQLELPRPFDEPWTAYAQAQEAWGLPFSDFAGRSVERITYRVENHPAAPDAQLNLFLCADEIIGGDVFLPGPEGFQTNLEFPK